MSISVTRVHLKKFFIGVDREPNINTHTQTYKKYPEYVFQKVVHVGPYARPTLSVARTRKRGNPVRGAVVTGRGKWLTVSTGL